MTQGTFDLYWIAVDADSQGQRVGSNLLNFLEEVVKAEGDGKGEYIMGTGRFEGIQWSLSFKDKRITFISPGLEETRSDIIVDGTSTYTLPRKWLV